MSTASLFHSLRRLGLAAGLGALLALPAHADGVPGRVALVTVLEGRAAVQLAGSDDWVDDVVNRPLASGDRLWIEDGGRAELHVGSSALRLGPRTALRLVSVGDDEVRVRLTAGSLNVRLRSLDDDDRFVVETPAADLELLAPGGYRIDADDGRDHARFTVWSGRAQVRGPQLQEMLSSNEAIDVDADSDAYPRVVRADDPDRLDLWAEQRDRREDDARAARYVPRDMVGYSELDAWGDWADDPEFGVLWFPHYVDPGWAPFRFGYWTYIGPWGWTWIDNAPWGFAPCHYGRWVRARHGWAWAPGPRRELRRPVFSPAVVTWIGLRPGRNDDPRRGGRVGWAPAGHERDPRFATAVDRDTFVNARPVAQRRIGLADSDLRRAQPIQAPRVEPVAPSRGRIVANPAPGRLPERGVFERRGPADVAMGRANGPTAPSGAGIRPRLPDAPGGNPVTRPLPMQRDVPAQRDAPMQREVPAQRDAPAQRDVPAWRGDRPERVTHDEPVRENRAQQVPAQEAPARAPWSQGREVPQQRELPQQREVPQQRELPQGRDLPPVREAPPARITPPEPIRMPERPMPEIRRQEAPPAPVMRAPPPVQVAPPPVQRQAPAPAPSPPPQRPHRDDDRRN